MIGSLPFSPVGGWLLPLARGGFMAGSLSAFGALLFCCVVLPRPGLTERASRGIARVATLSLAAAAVLLPAWAVLQAMAQTGLRWQATLPSIPGDPVFGYICLLQVAALLAALCSVRRARPCALVLCGLAVVLQAGHGHALVVRGGPSPLLAAGVAHLLAAGAWLGGLLPLLLAVRALPPADGTVAIRRFLIVAKASMVVLLATAVLQGWALIETIPGLVGTPYGQVTVLKLALFGALCAAVLATPHRLVRSIAVQTGSGLGAVLAAGLLGTLTPALQQEPTWPFPYLPSLVTVSDDPEARRMVVLALLVLGGASTLLAASLAVRRLRVTAAAVLAATAWVVGPDLRLLFVPAFPTTFHRSPTDFAATAIVHGAGLFARNCTVCHGVGGRGDGPAAAGLPVAPADLTQPHLWAHPEGNMFWWLTRGIEAPGGGTAMPGFAATLSPDDRWTLVDYVRANGAGAARRATGRWPVPVAAPELVANCPGRRTVILTSLRGRAVRLVFAGGMSPAAALDDPDLVTITVGRDASGCAAADPAVLRAYAIVLGTDPAALAGAELFVDPNGWLRPERVEGATPALLSALVRDICASPLAAASTGYRHEH